MTQWHRQNDLIYSLKQKGWKKGQPVMVNDIEIRVTGEKSEEILDKILAMLNYEENKNEMDSWGMDSWD